MSARSFLVWLVFVGSWGEGGGEVGTREHVILVYIFSSTLGGAVMLFGFHHLFFIIIFTLAAARRGGNT